MMDPVETKNVGVVYRKFIAIDDKRGWNGVDDYMSQLEYLDDDQLHREADVLFEKHSMGDVGCGKPNCSPCFVDTVLDAVFCILELYQDTGLMHKNNRYILENYLAMSQHGSFVES